jgi:hypothetical protein
MAENFRRPKQSEYVETLSALPENRISTKYFQNPEARHVYKYVIIADHPPVRRRDKRFNFLFVLNALLKAIICDVTTSNGLRNRRTHILR